MSHSVYILDSLSKLQTLEQVLTSFHELQSIQDGEVGQGLLAFARKLEELAPQIEPENEYLSNLYAGLEQLVKENYKRLLPIDMPPDEWVSTLKLMVEIAKEVNVAIWDDSIGMAFLPNGKILPNDKAKLWKNAIAEMEQVSEFPTTLSAFKKLAQSKIEALAFKHGFCDKGKNKYNEEFYEKNVHQIIQRIYFRYGGDGEFYIIAWVRLKINIVSDIYRKFSFALLGDEEGKDYINLGGKITEFTTEDITDLFELSNYFEMLNDRIFQLLESVQTIMGLDILLNCTPSIRNYVHHFFYMPHCLITARLANNPKFEELCVTLGTYGEGANRDWGSNELNYITEWPKLVKYLREEVKPLA